MFFLGLDLGQRRDHSAIVVVQRTYDFLLVRHIERVPLETPYPKVVARVREILRHPELAGRSALAVDSTGVGTPVVEMLRGAQIGCEITAVTITGGARELSYYASGGPACNVPKKDLIAGVQMRSKTVSCKLPES